VQDCWIYVVEQDSSGDIELLFPPKVEVARNVNNHVRANERRCIPDKSKGDEIVLSFTEPLGLERVVVLATPAPWDDFFSVAGMADGAARSVALTRSLERKIVSNPAPASAKPAGAAMPAMAVGELRFMLVA
jgi:hypothetical protein